jgi:hypothetical protein
MFAWRYVLLAAVLPRQEEERKKCHGKGLIALFLIEIRVNVKCLAKMLPILFSCHLVLC